MAERQLPKLRTRVRFPSPAPIPQSKALTAPDLTTGFGMFHGGSVEAHEEMKDRQRDSVEGVEAVTD